MSDIHQIVKMDQGGVNDRILAKESKADFRRIEAASVKMPTCFTSAEGKRFFVRLFNTLQLNMHFISVIARTRLDHDDIVKVEGSIRAKLDAVNESLNSAIDGAEALFKAHGITSVATYDTVALSVDEVSDGVGIVQLFVRAGLAASGKDAKRLITEGGAKVNDEISTDAGQMFSAADLAEPVKLTAGKKRHALVVIG